MTSRMNSTSSSPSSFWSGTTSEDVATPLTENSLLLDDQSVHGSATEEYILVVGGCGFIGSHTVFELAKAGYNVSLLLLFEDG
jgi:UDP-glucose 4-epimerase